MSDERKELTGKLGAMFAYSMAHMKTMGVSKGKQDEFKIAHRAIRQRLQQPEINEKWLENKTFEMIDIVSKGNILEAMRFIKSTISDARGLVVPVVRVKPERMDHTEKGALIGKPRSGPEEEGFPYECCEKCDRLIKQFACKGVPNAIECLYLLSKMKIKKKGD